MQYTTEELKEKFVKEGRVEIVNDKDNPGKTVKYYYLDGGKATTARTISDTYFFNPVFCVDDHGKTGTRSKHCANITSHVYRYNATDDVIQILLHVNYKEEQDGNMLIRTSKYVWKERETVSDGESNDMFFEDHEEIVSYIHVYEKSR